MHVSKVDLNLMSLDELMNRSTDSALRFNSQLYGTRLYLSTKANPDGADYTCTDGWVAISTATANLSSPVVVDALGSLLGIDTSTGDNALTKLTDSLQAIRCHNYVINRYLKAAVLEPSIMKPQQDVIRTSELWLCIDGQPGYSATEHSGPGAVDVHDRRPTNADVL